jgi:hypothetical protein
MTVHLYVDGSVVVMTEISTPDGAATSEAGLPLSVGNLGVVGSAWAWDGVIKDVRVYNMDKTAVAHADLAAGIAGEGAGGNGFLGGLVFNPFVVRTSELAAYIDQTLTASTKVFDAYNGFVGTPGGAPVGRDFTP